MIGLKTDKTLEPTPPALIARCPRCHHMPIVAQTRTGQLDSLGRRKKGRGHSR